MPITMNDLTISPAGIDMPSLLSDWEWAMPEPLRPVLLTAMGDVFAQGESGAVYFLDTAEGTVNPVADDGATFQSLLRDSQFVTDHMYPSRIVELRKAGKLLAPTEVYSHQQPLVLGGVDEVDNLEPTFACVAISLHGQIHQQVKDLPEGTKISGIEIE
jgi:hypothetical protein